MNNKKSQFEKYLKEYYNLVDECDNKGINWNEYFYNNVKFKFKY